MYKALVIDDEKPARQGIIALGHWPELGVDEIYEAMEGEGGLSILRNDLPDIVLVDMKMPGMDGAQFLEIASQEWPRVKYIVISGYDDFKYTKRAIKTKVVDYLLKPVVESELNEALTKAVDELDTERSRTIEQVERDIAQLKTTEKQNLYEIKEYIDQNFSHEIQLNIFAERYFLSKEYLSKLFKDEFGYNIYEYLLKVRMEKARKLLSDPEIKVATVSEHLGYHDNNYFSKAFKTYFGLSPTDYRESVQKKREEG